MTSIANASEDYNFTNKETNMVSLKVGRVQEIGYDTKKKTVVLILGAGRVCQPAVELLASIGSKSSRKGLNSCIADFEERNCVEVIVASLYQKDAEEVYFFLFS